MKKYLILIFCFFSFIICLIPISNDNEEVLMVSNIRVYNQREDEYHLYFDNESLNLSNIKLKLAIFTSYPCNITRIYLKYSNDEKKYFQDKEYISVTSNNINNIIDTVKNEYEDILKKENIYEEITNNNIEINKVVIECNREAIDRFKEKYPNVKIEYK